MRPDLQDRVVFRLSWKRRLAAALATLLVPASWLLPGLVTGTATVRPAGAVGAGLFFGVLLIDVLRVRTELSREGVTLLRLGRPPSLRPTTVAWRDIAMIEVRKRVAYSYPVLRLTDGREIWARAPSSQWGAPFADAITVMRQRHVAEVEREFGAGAWPHAAPAAPPVAASSRRRNRIAGVSAAVVAVDVAVLGMAVVHGPPEPPAARGCSLVPGDLVQRIAPGSRVENSGGSEPGSFTICHWRRQAGDADAASADLSVSAIGFGGDHARTSHEQDRLRAQAEHVIHPVTGVDGGGYTWAAARSGGTFAAEAHAYTGGGYEIDVELTTERVASRTEAEQQAAEVVRAVAAELEAN